MLQTEVDLFARRVVRLIEIAMEVLVLAMVCLSPWALGSVGAEFEFFLFAGIALLLALWAARMLVEWRVSWATCPVAMCLAGMIMLGVLQLAPLSDSTLGRISPGTSQLYNRLLPSQPEVLAHGEPCKSTRLPAGSTISLYPDATRKSLTYLLAIFSLFVIVRNNIASSGAIRRLSIALLANGAALSLFGLIQFFGNPEPRTIFWTEMAPGAPFGPFVNRNHFAFYINLCIGLSLGLLLVRGQSSRMHEFTIDLPMTTRLSGTLRDLLHDPGALWISGGLALMLSSVVFCLSRGGFLALIGALTLCGMLMLMRGTGNWRLCATLLSMATAMALLIWFGLERVEARLATLWTGEALADGRVFLLTHAWPLVKEFPIWGTGYGTFQFVEPLYLHAARDVGSIYEHAHNDYLESLIEGGAVGLLLRLLAIGFVFRFAYQAFRAYAGTATAALALGLLFTFTSIVIHSFFEFGLYVPSIAVLAAVLCAHISGLGAGATEEGESRESKSSSQRDLPPESQLDDAAVRDGDRRSLGSWSVAPLVGAGLAVVLGYFFYSEGYKAANISFLRSEARGLRRDAFAGAGVRASEIPLLQAVVSLDPNDAERRFVLSEAHFDVYKQRIELGQPAHNQTDSLANHHLNAALRHVLSARDLCPLLPAPHTRIAFYVDALVTADPRSTYIERAKFLAPVDPQLWYLSGLQELADNQPELAWKSWRRSLQLSDRFLIRILDRVATVLSPDQMLAMILPDQPDILLAAAMYLYPGPEASLERQPLLEKALTFYDNATAPLDPAAWHTKAELHVQLNQPTKALQAFQQALNQDPQQVEWRLELATLLHQQQRRQESRRELQTILWQNPNHGAARQLMEVLDRESTE